ncbi:MULTISPECIES: hypothetical protein [Arthrobacter]|uniref:Uncharacterized protein n=1 Tax=Arthrobacter terricola TaxID=2547396 RepID=A0A4R5L0S9_9MICC|nr:MULTISPECIES: hypothetical protein [Arthrobacter]MBT8160122.1 hypothetical protein [Arthrobacter sp. GN70]TDG01118.1 hypothetical protein E1809_03590 [Arthrobacter terricola]
MTAQTARTVPTPSSVGPTAGASVTLFSCFAGMGAGLVELSIASSYILPRGPLMLPGFVVAVWGLALLSVSVASLQRGRLRFRRLTARALAVAVVFHVAALTVGISQQVLDGGHLAALFLVLMTLGSSAWIARRYPDGEETSARPGARMAVPPHPGLLVAAAFAAAVVVAAITTPGLAASVAGQHAVPHQEHSLPTGHHH